MTFSFSTITYIIHTYVPGEEEFTKIEYVERAVREIFDCQPPKFWEKGITDHYVEDCNDCVVGYVVEKL